MPSKKPGQSNHGNDNNSDGTNKNENFSEDGAQDPKERRELRRKYRQLTENIKEQQHELTHDSDGLQQKLEECNSLFQNVRMTREAALDSQVIAQLSQLGRQKAQALQTDLVVFQPVEFCDKLMKFLRGGSLPENEPTPRISKEGWVRLGEAVQPFFKRSAPIHFMYGAFERGEKEKKERQKHVKKTEDIGEAITSKFKSINDINTMPKKESTTEQVHIVHGILQKKWKECERNPICYFEFVINPHSFDQTVENIFYTSFLVRDSLAKIFLDEDKLPVIEPVTKKDGRDTTQLPHQQVVLTLTKPEWKDIVEAYNIQVPIIPHRERLRYTEETELTKANLLSKKGKSIDSQRNGHHSKSSKTNGHIVLDSEDIAPSNNKIPKR